MPAPPRAPGPRRFPPRYDDHVTPGRAARAALLRRPVAARGSVAALARPARDGAGGAARVGLPRPALRRRQGRATRPRANLERLAPARNASRARAVAPVVRSAAGVRRNVEFP